MAQPADYFPKPDKVTLVLCADGYSGTYQARAHMLGAQSDTNYGGIAQ